MHTELASLSEIVGAGRQASGAALHCMHRSLVNALQLLNALSECSRKTCAEPNGRLAGIPRRARSLLSVFAAHKENRGTHHFFLFEKRIENRSWHCAILRRRGTRNRVVNRLDRHVASTIRIAGCAALIWLNCATRFDKPACAMSRPCTPASVCFLLVNMARQADAIHHGLHILHLRIASRQCGV